MTIYDLFEQTEEKRETENPQISHVHLFGSYGEKKQQRVTIDSPQTKNRFFSAIAARLFFFVLLLFDLLWSAYSFCVSLFFLSLHVGTGLQIGWIGRKLRIYYVNWRRSGVCFLSLIAAIFSPALGMMFGYSYFCMYDREGMSIVPSILREQFEEFFPT